MHCVCNFALLPILSTAACFLFCMVCYVIGVSNGDIKPLPQWPYLSDVGVLPPERCIFSFAMVWTATGIAFSCVLFYKYLKELKIQSKLNVLCLVAGIISSFGIMVVGCFQWTEVFAVHFTGACMSFGGLVLYGWILNVITWKELRFKYYSTWFVALRMTISALATASTVAFLIFLLLRKRSDVMFTLCTSTEWCCAAFGILTMATLAADLRHVTSVWINVAIAEGAGSKRGSYDTQNCVAINNNNFYNHQERS